MFSGLLLLLTWLIIASVLFQESILPRRVIPVISFVGAQSSLFLFYLFLIPLGASDGARLLLALYVLFGLGFFVVGPPRLRNAVQTIRQFLQLERFPVALMGESTILRRYFSQTVNAKILVSTLAICLLFLTSGLMASSNSWDSHTYNLARLAHMLIRRTPFITNSPSLPHAIFPLGHDLLYYPDILLGSLRGLGFVNTLEFIVLLGTLINICDLVCINGNQLPQQKVSCMLETAKLITVCLLISSDQQVLQALSSKNDLVITVYFAVACLVALAFLRDEGRFRLQSLVGCALLLTVFAATSKSYGLICMVPFVVLGVLKRRDFRSAMPLPRSSNSPMVQMAAWKTTSIIYGLSAALATFSVVFYFFTKINYSILPEYQSSVASLINRYGEPFSYAKAALLNGLRFLLNFATYPYSTWLKPSATSPDDYLLGLSPIVKLLSSDHFAIADGYGFQLIRYRGEDFSLSSPLLQLAALVAIITIANFFLFPKRGSQIKNSYVVSLQSVLDAQAIGLILFSSAASSLLFFSVMSYHNWYVKYLGFSYVCIIPIVSWLLVFNTAEICSSFEVSPEKVLKTSPFPALKNTLILLALALFVRLLSLQSAYFSTNFYPGTSSHATYKLYNEYLYSIGINSPEAVQKFYRQFSVKNAERLNLCFAEPTPTLPPLLELAKRNPDPEKIGIYPRGPNGCSLPTRGYLEGKNIVLP